MWAGGRGIGWMPRETNQRTRGRALKNGYTTRHVAIPKHASTSPHDQIYHFLQPPPKPHITTLTWWPQDVITHVRERWEGGRREPLRDISKNLDVVFPAEDVSCEGCEHHHHHLFARSRLDTKEGTKFAFGFVLDIQTEGTEGTNTKERYKVCVLVRVVYTKRR